MKLLDVKDYVRKTANIISSVADVQVIICDSDFNIIEDSFFDIPLDGPLKKLTPESILVTSVKERRMIVTRDCKKELQGCLTCPERSKCDICAMITVPIIDGKTVYGAIGIYTNEDGQVDRLVNQYNNFFEFLHRIAELLVMKLNEEGKVRELTEKVAKLQNNESMITFDDIIGSSPEIILLKESARRFSKSNSTILIRGESGTGKEILARAIHNESNRSMGPFVAINCAAIPENLVESELFGYEEGAFTGAKKRGKIGKFELANGGTLFLDEVGEFPLFLQAKLLRVLQERKIQRIGGNNDINVDIRIICATNRNLEIAISEGQFREDLYYRLNVIPLHLPSLRERKTDIIELAEYFLNIYAKELRKDIFGFNSYALNCLLDYSWPGNIRELQNVVEYAVNCCDNSYIGREDLPKMDFIKKESAKERMILRPLKDVENEYIKEAIRVYGDSLDGKETAAKILGISKATLYRRLKEIKEGQ